MKHGRVPSPQEGTIPGTELERTRDLCLHLLAACISDFLYFVRLLEFEPVPLQVSLRLFSSGRRSKDSEIVLMQADRSLRLLVASLLQLP